MKKGEIYFVELGEKIGSEQGGKRPVLILDNGHYGHVVTAALTTKRKKELPVHIALSAEETGLKLPSFVLLEQIISVPKEKLVQKMGYLESDQKWGKIHRGLRISLGL